MALARKSGACLVVIFALILITKAETASEPECKSTCENTAGGYYASCTGCQEYISCSDSVLVQMKCPENTSWDDTSKTCTHGEFQKCRHGDTRVMSGGNALEDESTPNMIPFDKFESDFHKLFKKWLHKKSVSSQADKYTVPDNMEGDLKLLSKNFENEMSVILDPGSGAEDLPIGDVEELKLYSDNGVSRSPAVIDEPIPQNVGKQRLSLSTDPSDGLKDIRHYLEEISSKPARQKKAGKEKVSGECIFRPANGVATFDRHKLSVIGDCRYVATKLCSSSDFFVEVKMTNCNLNDTVAACVDYVDIQVHKNWARLHSVGVAFADGIVIPPGRSETNKQFSVKTEAEFCQLETVDGVTATLDRQHRFFLFLPDSYSGKICGLCGNLNGDPTDDVRVSSSVFDYSIRPIPDQSLACAQQFAAKKRESNIVTNEPDRQ